MSITYASVDEAMARGGLRMVVVGGVPSLWGEAAKGLLHIKQFPWTAVRLDHGSEPLARWAGQRSGPVAMYEDERPRAGWAEILLLAERLAPAPALIPIDPSARACMFGLAHEICGEAGLGWARRLQLIDVAVHGGGGFPVPIAQYLARKYGYRSDTGATAGPRVAQLLGLLATHLRAQHAAGRRYFVGDGLTAVDVYAAAAMAMFAPLPAALCAMDARMRAAFELRDDATAAALDPILLGHRDMMYAEHLALPLSL
jgi:glutathione S-transferase